MPVPPSSPLEPPLELLDAPPDDVPPDDVPPDDVPPPAPASQMSGEDGLAAAVIRRTLRVADIGPAAVRLIRRTVSRTTPQAQEECYVARLGGSGEIVWRSPPLPHASHVVVDSQGRTLASELGADAWTLSVVDTRGGVLASKKIPSAARASSYAYGRRVGRAAARAGGWLLVGRVNDGALELLVLGELGDVLAQRQLPAPPDCWGLSAPDTGCTTDYAVDPTGAVVVVGRANARLGFVTLVGPAGGWTHRLRQDTARQFPTVWPYRVAVDGHGGAVVAGGLERLDLDGASPSLLFLARFRVGP